MSEFDKPSFPVGMNAVEIKTSSIHGMGVFTLVDWPKGSWIYIFGIPLTKELCDDNPYCIEAENGMWWEPFPPWRFLNHSDAPNAYVDTCGDGFWFVAALREIKIGEEVTIDYGFDPSEEERNSLYDNGTKTPLGQEKTLLREASDGKI